jgi:uncharacterized surface protein with fasciclin (FAS1) repeats
MYIYDRRLSDSPPPQGKKKTLADELKEHIKAKGSTDAEKRIEEERQSLGRTIVLIAENHSAETRSVDLARRLMKNDVYRFIASEYFLNAGEFRIEIRQFLRGLRKSLGRLLCPYITLLRDLMVKPRYILFMGSRAEALDERDRRLALHFVEEHADRKLNKATPGVLVCGITHGSIVTDDGQEKTMRVRLEDKGFKILGARLATDDIDRASIKIGKPTRTDRVWPVGVTQTAANTMNLVDLVSSTGEYTVVSTKGSPFERLTDNASETLSTLSMAQRYELVIIAKKMTRPC